MKLLSIRKLLSARPEERPTRNRNGIALTDRSAAYVEAARARLRGYFGPEVPAFAEPLRYLYVNPLEVQLRCSLSYPPGAARPRQRSANYGRIVPNTKRVRDARAVYVYSLDDCLPRRVV